MELTTNSIGSWGGNAAKIIELTVTDWGGGSKITEVITDLNGKVNEDLINSLRNIADELEEQNNKLK